ncbi:sulfotransferase [Pseudomonadales bacterium]|nr:sulfotransferase [Pseudomonadales bacterium]
MSKHSSKYPVYQTNAEAAGRQKRMSNESSDTPKKSHINQQPDFIGIGAARSGTTWISEQLSQHPAVWIPSRKELHYWTRKEKYKSPSFLGQKNIAVRYFFSHYSFDLWLRFIRAIGKSFIDMNAKSLKWNLSYFLGRPNNEWYSGLFAGHPEKITGEFTPAYSLMDDEDVSDLVSAYPKIKAIMILRNPIERAWSTILYHDKRRMISIADMTREEIKEYLSKSQILERSDYLSIINRWSSRLAKDQLLIVYYDEISNNPAKLYAKIAKFLDLDPGRSMSSSFAKKVNASKPETLPGWLAEHLKAQYISALKQMALQLGDYPAAWYEEYK